MEFMRTSRSSRYLLVLWLGLSLMLAQTLGVHLHMEHAHHSEAVSDHHVDLHAGLMSHTNDLDHQASAIDIGPDILLKNSTSMFSIAFIAFFSLLLIAPLRQQLCRPRFYQSDHRPDTCLLQPPLRAPPGI